MHLIHRLHIVTYYVVCGADYGKSAMLHQEIEFLLLCNIDFALFGGVDYYRVVFWVPFMQHCACALKLQQIY